LPRLQFALAVDRALYCVDDAPELRQHVVARRVHHAPAMAGHGGRDDRAILGDGANGRDLVVAHEPAVAFDVRAQDGGESALDGTPAHCQEFYRGRRLERTTSSQLLRPAWRLRAMEVHPGYALRPRLRSICERL